MSNELIVYEKGVPMLGEDAERKLIGWTESIKVLQESLDELKAQIKQDMEENGVIKIDTPNLLINYIAETEKETFQVKAFKAEWKELYDNYCKLTKVAPQIRIRVKE